MWLLLNIRFHNTIPISGFCLLWLSQRHWRLRRHARGRLPAGSRPPLHPRWQLSNHVRVCTRLCVHCAWLLFYPGVDIFHWGGSLVNECSGPWCEWLFSSPVQLGSCWSIARLNCWNNIMNMLVMLWLLSIVKKKLIILWFFQFFSAISMSRCDTAKNKVFQRFLSISNQ